MTKKRTSLAKLFSIVLLAIILVIQVACPVEGISSSKTLNVPLIKQEKTWWCWAACGASVVQYVTNTNCSQEQFCLKTRNNTEDIPADIYEIYAGLEKYNLTGICFEDTIPMDVIMGNINNNKPIVANRVKTYYGHALLIDGYSYYNDMNTALIVYMDPDDGENHSMEYRYFVQTGDILSGPTWSTTIYNISK